MLKALKQRYWLPLKSWFRRKNQFCIFLGWNIFSGKAEFLCSKSTHIYPPMICKDAWLVKRHGYSHWFKARFNSAECFFESNTEEYSEYQKWWRELPYCDKYKADNLWDKVAIKYGNTTH